MQRPLPHDDTIAAAAIRSVHGRGFYDSAPHGAQDTHLMAQVLRLVEETGEYQSARMHNLSASEQGSEIADVAIVAYQIAWLTGIPLDSLQKVPLAGTNFSIEIGALARALRKWNGRTDSSGDIARALQRTVALCHILAEQMGLRLPDLVTEKLAADERRGYQHSGAVL